MTTRVRRKRRTPKHRSRAGERKEIRSEGAAVLLRERARMYVASRAKGYVRRNTLRASERAVRTNRVHAWIRARVRCVDVSASTDGFGRGVVRGAQVGGTRGSEL